MFRDLDATSPLLGREREQRLLASLLDGAVDEGQTLLLLGETGVGKSRLLAEVARMARDRGMSLLTAAGVQSEADFPFGGLHQLLRPVRARIGEMAVIHRAALDAAFGLDTVAPERYRIAMAALDFFSELASENPLLLMVDDVQWLDRPTADLLAFVARRIESDPIVMLVAMRDGYGSSFGDADLREHRLDALDDGTALALLDAAAPLLSPSARDRVLREAAGNPLALIELPLGIGARDEDWALAPLPLTERLERTFAARVAELPSDTRLALLIAALDDGDAADEVISAASLVAGVQLDLDALTPAVRARILDVEFPTFRFRHPLIRSAIVQSAEAVERRRGHEAIAQVLAGQPDRRAWHRSALLVGEHEEVALELDAAATSAQRRGAVAVAVRALRRAADLSDEVGRTRRLLEAGRLAVELGRRDAVDPIVTELRRLELTELEQARVSWIEETSVTRPLRDHGRFKALIAAAERAGSAGDHDLHVDLLWLVASRSWWYDPGPEVRGLLIDSACRLGDAGAEDPRIFGVHAYADPVGHAAGVLSRLETEATRTRLDPDAARFFGPAALVVGAFDLGTQFLSAAADGLRDEGRLGHLPRLLSLYAGTAARQGDWSAAITAGEEARRLASEFAEPHWEAAADTAIAMVAAMHGDEQRAELLSARAEAVAEPVGANITMAFAQFGRILAALATGHHSVAYDRAQRLFTPTDSAYHPVISSWAIADLAEAAIHIDRIEEARSRVAQVEAIAGPRPGAWTSLTLAHARALLAEPDEAGELFEAALETGLHRWPFQRARIQLAYGGWLRRHHRVGESRNVLRAARDTFDALACQRWSEHARRELRASGERSRRRVPDARDQLTAQELQIAQLAAQGLSNREIGQRLYLSHRTISTHLYHVFPKLGITSRGELDAALAPLVDDDGAP